MKRTLRILLVAYYAVYVAAILAATSGYYILKSGFNIDPLTSNGTIINSFIIIYILSTVPLALAIFNKMTKKWALIQDENERLEKYQKGGILRIAIIGGGLVLGVVFFYIMNSQSMIFCAGIAAVALFFCKPSEIKLVNDLNMDNTNNNI
ncbi:MAG: hypothetical protein ACOYM7_09505 [Paludibacter sp.]